MIKKLKELHNQLKKINDELESIIDDLSEYEKKPMVFPVGFYGSCFSLRSYKIPSVSRPPTVYPPKQSKKLKPEGELGGKF